MLGGQVLHKQLTLLVKKENMNRPKIQTLFEEGPARGLSDHSVFLINYINRHCQICRHDPHLSPNQRWMVDDCEAPINPLYLKILWTLD
jgi:hypothetical protein